MLDLSRVTCFAIDNTPRIEDTIKSIYTCMDVASFGEVKLVTTSNYVVKYKDSLSEDGIIVEEQVKPLTNIDEYNEYILYHMYKHIYHSEIEQVDCLHYSESIPQLIIEHHEALHANQMRWNERENPLCEEDCTSISLALG